MSSYALETYLKPLHTLYITEKAIRGIDRGQLKYTERGGFEVGTYKLTTDERIMGTIFSLAGMGGDSIAKGAGSISTRAEYATTGLVESHKLFGEALVFKLNQQNTLNQEQR